ncbi:MAG: hypothetical protein EOM68_25035 [Spirochaetia bacterium]|nr:hypothetical protein [Spirochaetia bacterium]
MNNAILVNLQRCTGCWTCSLACKMGNNLPDDTWRQIVRTLGSGEGIDKPAGTWPDLHLEWQPVWLKGCTMCQRRTQEGELPFCVMDCPNRALTFGDIEDQESEIFQQKEELRKQGFRIFDLPCYEATRPGIIYARK